MKEERLVLYDSQWQVCFKEERLDEDGRPYRAWINKGAEFCRVGREFASFALPGLGHTNFHGDRFTFAIDRKSLYMEKWERCGGADNAVAARRAFNAFVAEETLNTEVRLRHGSRLIDQAKGTRGSYGSGT